ncbi:MAG TPA: hypothetical protein VEW03_14130 [Longimicrobiaceae bacterium]|nr:hypothetical protein [Longimicrobiaceae bacterium]
MKRILLAASVCAALFTTAVAATAQDEWVRQVRRLLIEAGRRFEAQGYEMTHDIYTGSLNDDGSTMVTLNLSIGTEYQILGQCDEDCTDLDLVLFDGAGNQIDSDLLEDDYPVVSVVPRRSGSFRVRVSMATCSVEPCRYGIGVFGK